MLIESLYYASDGVLTCPGAVVMMTDWLHYMADVHIRSYKQLFAYYVQFEDG